MGDRDIERNSRQAKYDFSAKQAAKVRAILEKNGVTFGEALSYSSEMFQILAVMGEASPMLAKALAYLAIRLQGSEMYDTLLSNLTNGVLNKHKLLDTSSETSEDVTGD